ncbi:peptidoglycan-binding domain-containing protein [Streptosporangium sp. CA-135522]|uniref:peptidoglycan-binding domain-containing protein n=1 Tax=Streptosporangium sp. CA-135522 TaxID=3240072 RepID=UPI003D91D0BC
MLAVVLAVAGIGWEVSTRLRFPADEAAARKPPKPSLVTAEVERRKLVSTVAVSGALEYGSPYPVSLAGVVGGGDTTQRATRAPRTGAIAEGAVVMEVNGRPVFVFSGKVPMHRSLVPGVRGADVEQLQKALRRLGYRSTHFGRCGVLSCPSCCSSCPAGRSGWPAAVQAGRRHGR